MSGRNRIKDYYDGKWRFENEHANEAGNESSTDEESEVPFTVPSLSFVSTADVQKMEKREQREIENIRSEYRKKILLWSATGFFAGMILATGIFLASKEYSQTMNMMNSGQKKPFNNSLLDAEWFNSAVDGE